MATTAQAEDRRSIPERTCTVCLQGHYVTHVQTDPTPVPGKDSGRMPWHIEACSHCGHVQIFRRDWRE